MREYLELQKETYMHVRGRKQQGKTIINESKDGETILNVGCAKLYTNASGRKEFDKRYP